MNNAFTNTCVTNPWKPDSGGHKNQIPPVYERWFDSSHSALPLSHHHSQRAKFSKKIDSTEIANEESLTWIWTSVPTSGPDAKHLDTETLDVLGSER